MRYNVYRDSLRITPTPIEGPPFDDIGLTPNTAHNYYVTAVNDDGVESLPSLIIPGRTDPVVIGGDRADYSHYWPADGNTTPTSLFDSFGVGYQVQSGAAMHLTPGVDGDFCSGFMYKQAQLSTDHSSTITYALGAGYQVSGDRSAQACVRGDVSDPLHPTYVAAESYWTGDKSCQIVTVINGVRTMRAGFPANSLTDGDQLMCTARGNAYTATVISGANGSVTDIGTWVDNAAVFPFDNLHTGGGWRHRRVGGLWAAPALSGWWRGTDLEPQTLVGDTEYDAAFLYHFAGIQDLPPFT